ncbi:hypothetical protein B0J13DRAFT_647795 [Dactylonectria estremocensis]|uniref:MADS-box domain-containing protein n=1 Tax=Dactylonectria estremocensis TaxID=1079267 RepID=A0A9P9DPL1_9HYPO|nr:hypothetical protein B0J13DRAFT_647795 [Dactylonectria estremocensis]
MARYRSERNRDRDAGIKNRRAGMNKKANTFYHLYGGEVLVLTRGQDGDWSGFQSHPDLVKKFAKFAVPEGQILTPSDFPARDKASASDSSLMSSPSSSSQFSAATERSTQSSSPSTSSQFSVAPESTQSSSPFSSSQFSATTEGSMQSSSPSSSQSSATPDRQTYSAITLSSNSDSPPRSSLPRLPSALFHEKVQSGGSRHHSAVPVPTTHPRPISMQQKKALMLLLETYCN